MAFNQSDVDAVNQANAAGLQSSPHDTGNTNIEVWRIYAPAMLPAPNAVDLLNGVIHAGERFFGNGDTTTVWIDVQGAVVPLYVLDAVKRCHHTGIGIVVTCNGQTSAAGALRNAALQAALQDVGRTSNVWDPISGSMSRPF